jgi:WD40 repeat protein
MEQHEPFDPTSTGTPKRDFDVGVWNLSQWAQKATIPKCLQLLDVGSGGNVVAVVREAGIEIWEVSTAKLLKSAPFKHTQIDAVAFSPDAKLLAISDRNDLVLWNWEENQHERIDLGRCVGSLAFSPDGKFLAEGPTPRDSLQIRDLKTRKVVKTLKNGTEQSMNVPAMTYAQSGRVLIGCDNITLGNEIAVPHRVNLWDLDDATLAHEITVPNGLPVTLDASPNGRYLVSMLEEGEDVILSVWRLDAQNPMREPEPRPPAATQPR